MKIIQVDEKDNLVADLGPPVPDDAPAVPAPESAPTPPPRTPPRPSLEVETEVHAHLAPRLEAHLRRIESWNCSEEHRRMLETVLAHARQGFTAVGNALAILAEAGFVAKTTALTRKRAALRPGVAVKLRDDIHAKTVDLFHTADELATLTVVKVGESSVMLKTKEGREVGPLPLAHVVVA